MVLEAFEEAVGGDQRDLGVPVLTRVGSLGFAAKLLGHRLHAVADAEQRQPAVEHLLRRDGRTVFGGRLRPPRQDDALGRELRDLRRVVVPRPDLAINADFPDAARDQLRVLRAEIEDEDLVGMEVHGGRDW